MKDLKIVDLYSNSDDKKVESFSKSLDSSLEVSHSFDDYIYGDDWLEKIESSIRYIENILKNPNRFIVNEEEVVKIELARKITVESIKHLSRNTNLIQDIDEKTGDVQPSKILNINKEESFNTYENRFIYSLIKNLDMYINRKKRDINTSFARKNEKTMKYSGMTKMGSENVNISIDFNSKVAEAEAENSKIAEIVERIKKVEILVASLKQSDVYTILEKSHVAMVRSPIKKTNMILKNTNFQIAVELWNYLQTHLDDESKSKKGDNVIKDDPALKEWVDEVFMINYLVADSLDSEGEEKKAKKKVASEYLVNNFVQKVVTTNNEITQKELTDMVEKQFIFIKNQNLTETNEIKKIFKIAIKDYRKSTEDAKLEVENEKRT